ncbi:MAG: CRTAC1 family protein [Rhodobacter sp.]|nr:CRTAC1 family protein [Rhodobacter sp.]
MRALLIALLPGAALAGDPVFLDRSSALPVEHIYGGGWEHFVGGGVAVFDCDGDALPDIFAAGGENPVTLLRNTTPPGGDLTFAQGDFPGLTDVTGAYPLDIDSDGHLDLAVLRVGPNKLYRGGPDCSFTDATAAWGLVPDNRWTTAFSATWEPGQDMPTLAFGNYVDRTDPDGPFQACDAHQIYRPEGARYGPPLDLTPGYCALSLLFSDWSRRGRADLRLSNDRHYYVRGGAEQMWRPDQNRFLGPEDGWEKLSIWGMGIASRDLNEDGLPDIVLTSMGDQILQHGTGTGFVTLPYSAGATAHRPHVGDDGRPSTGWHAAFGDVDNDRLPDLFIAKGNVDQMPGNAMADPNNLLVLTPEGRFVEVGATAGIATTDRSRGAALADLNADGRLDLVVVNRRAPMELWQNATETGHGWAAIELRQPGANPRAVGAWVELRTPDGLTYTQERTVGGGHAGGSALPLYFGLESYGSAEARVIWPDGATSGWLPIAANRTTTITRTTTAPQN